jgi:hypothetical protein
MNTQANSTQPTDAQRREMLAALASTISPQQQAWNREQWTNVLAWNAQEQKAKGAVKK